MLPSFDIELEPAARSRSAVFPPQRHAPCDAAESSSAATLALRLSQRALAACFEEAVRRRGHTDALTEARLMRRARRTLSALSADDRSQLERWLRLQLTSGAPAGRIAASRIDEHLGAIAFIKCAPEATATCAGGGVAA